jgi:hypothetical protein
MILVVCCTTVTLYCAALQLEEKRLLEQAAQATRIQAAARGWRKRRNYSVARARAITVQVSVTLLFTCSYVSIHDQIYLHDCTTGALAGVACTWLRALIQTYRT